MQSNLNFETFCFAFLPKIKQIMCANCVFNLPRVMSFETHKAAMVHFPLCTYRKSGTQFGGRGRAGGGERKAWLWRYMQMCSPPMGWGHARWLQTQCSVIPNFTQNQPDTNPFLVCHTDLLWWCWCITDMAGFRSLILCGFSSYILEGKGVMQMICSVVWLK